MKRNIPIDYQAKKEELAKELLFLKEFGQKPKMEEINPDQEIPSEEKGDFIQEWD